MHRRESAEIQMHRREDIYCAQMLGARVSVIWCAQSGHVCGECCFVSAVEF